MPQDLMNFSEALVINPRLEVKVTVCVHGLVHGRVELNGHTCNIGENIISVGLLDLINLTSTIEQFDEGSSGIEITSMTVNGYEVIPKYQHYSSSGNAYHDWIGKWELQLTDPFYVWYHDATGQGWIA